MESTDTLPVFFTEMPYSTALETAQLLLRCANCYNRVHDNQADCECARVAYCSEKCRTADEPLHRYECFGACLNNPVSSNHHVDLQVRLLGRLLARLELDNGRATLSDGFPSALAGGDRRLQDLMSHKGQVLGPRGHPKFARNVLDAFAQFFKFTELGDLKKSMVRRWYCVGAINGFVVTCRVNQQPDSYVDLGQSVYLNASRFNHSCRPSLLYFFDGCRIVVKHVRRPGAGADQQPPKLTSKKQLHALTFNYGYGNSYCYGTSFTLRKGRMNSLRSRYFFRCRCELCSDKRGDRLASDASTVECRQCAKPYLWHWRLDGKLSLKRSCRCSTVERKLPVDEETKKQVRDLQQRFDTAMNAASLESDYESVRRRLSDVAQLASANWHQSCNLRLGQLYEKLFDSCFNSCPDTKPDSVRPVVEHGEAMMRVYLNYYEPYSASLAIAAQRLAEMYRSLDNRQRALHWLTVAANVWQLRGELDCRRQVDSLAKELTTVQLNQVAPLTDGQQQQQEQQQQPIPVA